MEPSSLPQPHTHFVGQKVSILTLSAWMLEILLGICNIPSSAYLRSARGGGHAHPNLPLVRLVISAWSKRYFSQGVQCPWGGGSRGRFPSSPVLPRPTLSGFSCPSAGEGFIFQVPLSSGLCQGLLPSQEEGRVIRRRFPGAGRLGGARGQETRRPARELRRWGASSLLPPFRPDPPREGGFLRWLPGRPARKLAGRGRGQVQGCLPQPPPLLPG